MPQAHREGSPDGRAQRSGSREEALVAQSTVDRDPSTGEPSGPYAMPRGLIVLLSAAAAVVALGGLRVAAGLLGPVFLALMLTVTATPLNGWLRRKGAPAWAAVTATV